MDKDARDKLLDLVAEEKAREQWEQNKALKNVDSSELVAELYHRGVTIKDIFGRYYEYEVAGDGRTMDVEDAEVAQ